jgi:DNA-binding PadR family transcriptional regulator
MARRGEAQPHVQAQSAQPVSLPFAEEGAESQMARTFRRMGEQAWQILYALHAVFLRLGAAVPGFLILEEVEQGYAESDYPVRRLDPSTLHYALERMEEDGLIKTEAEQAVDVPGPHGSTVRRLRPVYSLTGLGAEALSRRAAYERLRARQVQQSARRRNSLSPGMANMI